MMEFKDVELRYSMKSTEKKQEVKSDAGMCENRFNERYKLPLFGNFTYEK